jgi:hypothetical protein
VDKLFHDLNFFEGLVAFKGVDVDALEGKRSVLTILGEVNAAEATLSDCLDDLVMLHDGISSFSFI